ASGGGGWAADSPAMEEEQGASGRDEEARNRAADHTPADDEDVGRRRQRHGRRAVSRCGSSACTSASTARSAAFRIGALGFLLIATMVPARRSPTRCSIAPLMARPT